MLVRALSTVTIAAMVLAGLASTPAAASASEVFVLNATVRFDTFMHVSSPTDTAQVAPAVLADLGTLLSVVPAHMSLTSINSSRVSQHGLAGSTDASFGVSARAGLEPAVLTARLARAVESTLWIDRMYAFVRSYNLVYFTVSDAPVVTATAALPAGSPPARVLATAYTAPVLFVLNATMMLVPLNLPDRNFVIPPVHRPGIFAVLHANLAALLQVDPIHVYLTNATMIAPRSTDIFYGRGGLRVYFGVSAAAGVPASVLSSRFLAGKSNNAWLLSTGQRYDAMTPYDGTQMGIGMSNVAEVTSAAALPTPAITATMRIAGTRFATLINGSLSARAQLAAAVQQDLSALLDVDASRVFVTNMSLGSLVVNFNVSAGTFNSTPAQLSARIANTANSTALWLSSTQNVYNVYTDASSTETLAVARANSTATSQSLSPSSRHSVLGPAVLTAVTAIAAFVSL